ncbi:TonB-dependent receptor plug domain-containing protein [Bradyrhizobium sp. STM 3557]|uniref:TonB-dependent receptor plug domain-containing protein n=1 Tax=Bradyrhizobium sp. STM 3557 TaxID=578920 RepID=UPI0038907D56
MKGATGVSAGDAPNDVSFAMRGFQGNQINATYDGIGPTGFTALTMETFNLDRVEFLKGPSSGRPITGIETMAVHLPSLEAIAPACLRELS